MHTNEDKAIVINLVVTIPHVSGFNSPSKIRIAQQAVENITNSLTRTLKGVEVRVDEVVMT